MLCCGACGVLCVVLVILMSRLVCWGFLLGAALGGLWVLLEVINVGEFGEDSVVHDSFVPLVFLVSLKFKLVFAVRGGFGASY